VSGEAGQAPEDRPDPRIAKHAWVFLVVSALASAAFFHVQYRRDNAAPDVDLAAYSRHAPPSLVAGVEHCHRTPRKIAVEGWVARQGVGAGVRRVRAVIVDRAGRGFAMKTSLRDREDVSARLNQRFGDRTRYRNAGFNASIGLAAAGLAPEGARLLLAYDDGEVRALLPLSCDDGAGS